MALQDFRFSVMDKLQIDTEGKLGFEGYTIPEEDLQENAITITQELETVVEDTYAMKTQANYIIGKTTELVLNLSPQNMTSLEKLSEAYIEKDETTGAITDATKMGLNLRGITKPFVVEPNQNFGLFYYRVYFKVAPKKNALADMNVSRTEVVNTEVPHDVYNVRYNGKLVSFVQANDLQTCLEVFKKIIDESPNEHLVDVEDFREVI